MDGSDPPGAPLFEAMIVPHRSLSPRGLRILIGVICGLSCLTVLRFWLIGAWPVAGFSAIELGLAVFLLRLNANRARASELVLLSEDALRVTRTDMHGKREELHLSGWLNVVLEERQGRTPALLVTARAVRVEVGASLGEHEKRDLATSLRDALDRWRSPRFDNPQLRDD